MIKLKELLKESIGGLVTIPAIGAPMNYEEKKPVQELEYTPGDLPEVLKTSQNLGKLLNKLKSRVKKDLDRKESAALDDAIKAYKIYFSELKKLNKALKW